MREIGKFFFQKGFVSKGVGGFTEGELRPQRNYV